MAQMKDLHTLPDNLPAPVDDGACDHLLGRALPAIALASTTGEPIDLHTYTGIVVIYFYPMLGRPDAAPLVGWNEIPGARGCTPQSCAFRDQYAELRQLRAQVFGVSAQPLADQKEASARLHLPFALLNDAQLTLARALRLPTFVYESATLIKRLTIIAKDGVIQKVFYPIFPPNENAAEVIAWLTTHPS